MKTMETVTADVPGITRRSPIAVLRLLRPHQWSKNLLLAVPLLLSHQPPYLHRWPYLLLAFLSFCLAASGGYIVNDLHDLSADRAHPRKRTRPLASGAVSVFQATTLLIGLFAGAVLLALWRLPPGFVAALLAYILLTVAYSLFLKARLLVDVFALAVLYCIRLLAGGAAIDLEITPWLLAFAVFLFLSLAFAKRFTELAIAGDDDAAHLRARNYRLADRAIMATVGSTSGYLAVLVFAIYLNTDLARQQYQQPRILWLVGLILLYWLTRIWFLAARQELNEDPVLFALRDRVSWCAGVLVTALVVLAATM